MSELIPDFPEQSTPVEDFTVDSIPEAIRAALFSEGVAVIERLGVSDDVRGGILRSIIDGEDATVFEDGWNAGVAYYNDFEPEDIQEITDLIFAGLDEYLQEQSAPVEHYDAVNLQINSYSPGVGLLPHVDFDQTRTASSMDYDPAESLTIIYVMQGCKDLVIWPQGVGQDRQAPRTIEQRPDMLIVFRGGSFEHNDLVYPALWHGVPAVDSSSAILTFDLMPRSKREREIDDLDLDLQMNDDFTGNLA